MRLRPLFARVLLAAAVLTPIACKQSSDGGGAARPRVKLPDPLALPAQPVAAAFIAEPGAGLALVDPWVQESLTPVAVLERGLTQFTTEEVAAWIAPAIDSERAWSSVRLGDGEELAFFPVKPDAVRGLSEALGALSRAGKFGAVRLPERPSVDAELEGPWSHKPHLAWLDEQAQTLTIATSLPGLVTGPKLEEAYGKAPIFLTIDGSMIPTSIVPLSRVTAEGSIEDLLVTASFGDDFDPGPELQIEEGALTGLLAAPGMVVGATSRFANHEETVKRLILNVKDTVEQQPFLMQGILQDMQKKLNAVLRSWNGRFMVALGPPGHVRIAYGSDDPKRSGVAVLRLLQTVVDNVKLLRNFTDQIPPISVKQKAGEGGGEPIHRLTVSRAKSLMQPQLHGLLDGDDKLRVAMAWSRHAGAGMVVVGPSAVPTLERWLTASARAASGEDTLTDFGAVVVALDPKAAPDLRARELEPQLLLGLAAQGPRRTVIAQRVDERTFQLRLQSPPSRMQRRDVE